MQFLPLLYVISGSLNVLLIKWSDNLQGECRDGKTRSFFHPIVQTALMFLGEFLCFLIYKIVYFFLRRREDDSENVHLITRGEGREFSPMSMILPAALDTIASVLLFTGLYLSYASSFQMLRGSALIFVGIFGSMYLSQTITLRHWSAMLSIACGVAIVILTDTSYAHYGKDAVVISDRNSILTGNLLIICAQIFHAAQFVYEEKTLKDSDIPPMLATGWQGIFGLCITILLGACTNFLPIQMAYNSGGVVDDLGDVITQIRSQPLLLAPLIVFTITTCFYKFSALCIVKYSSTTNRILADVLRVIFIWSTVVMLNWENLNLLTILGFLILVMGTLAYRNAIFLEYYRSILARLQRRSYATNVESAPVSQPADVI